MGGFSTQVLNNASVPAATAPYRPAQWSKGKPNTSVTVTDSSTSNVSSQLTDTSGNNLSGGSAAGGGTTNSQSSTTTYFFDAVLSADHYTELVITRHPVQSGASIVDHAYAEPARVVLEVGFSDVMDSFTSGQYASNSSKSVSAYQTFVRLQKGRLPITLTTHLQTYENMLIKSIRAADTNMTVQGAKMTIIFEQIIIAQTSTQQVSARPNQSNSTNTGSEQPTSVPPSMQVSHTPSGIGTSSSSNPNPQWSSDPAANAGSYGFVTSGVSQ
jgi:hypothetical protein